MDDTNTTPVRINKYLAQQGLASRREADELIAAGRVFVNGHKALTGQKINHGDQVEVTGVSPSYNYFLYHKPVGQTTEEIKLPVSGTDKILPIGRLDKESRGLMLLTDDRRVTGRLLDPEFGHEREYVVTVNKHLSPSFARIIGQGMTIDEDENESWQAKPARVTILDDKTFKIILTEGKRHQIRRMCAALGFEVRDLLRTRIMDLRLGQMKPGTRRALRPQERTKLLEALDLA